MISGGLGVLFLCFSVISSLEMSSDGLRMDECGAIVIPQEKTAARAVTRHLCLLG